MHSILKSVVLSASLLVPVFSSFADDNKVSDAALANDPKAMVEDGARLSKNGANMVARGQNRLAQGRKQVSDGEKQLQEATQSVKTAKTEYLEAAELMGNSASAKSAGQDAKRLQKIGDRWERAINHVRDGNLKVETGRQTIDRAQAEIREGRLLMQRGAALIRNGERMRLGQKPLPAAPSSES